MKLILASNSPRRKEILEKFGYRFTVIKSDYEEKEDIFDPRLLVKTFAEKKAESVFSSLSEAEKDEAVVLGADTVVVLNGKILGKPKDDRDAVNMLKSLSGRTHLVLTGYAVITGGKTFSLRRCVPRCPTAFCSAIPISSGVGRWRTRGRFGPTW